MPRTDLRYARITVMQSAEDWSCDDFAAIRRFDVSNWLFLMAFDGDKAVGGATVAFRSPNIHMLQGRDDLAAECPVGREQKRENYSTEKKTE